MECVDEATWDGNKAVNMAEQLTRTSKGGVIAHSLSRLSFLLTENRPQKVVQIGS